jgi:hypothetical protein
MKLREIAYSRSGDKGCHANIGLIAKTADDYHFLEKELSAEKVKDFFHALSPHEVIRYPLPKLLAFNFILKGVLKKGGNFSLRNDAQGKTLGQALLEIEI